MALRIPLGISDFRKLRELEMDYVDKSLLIRDIIDDTSDVLLLPRPRRFGKTLNLSMLRYYFERHPADRWPLFQDLAIARQGPLYHEHFQRYPTIFMTFKDLKSTTWPECLAASARLLASIYGQHHEVLSSLRTDEARVYQAVLEERASQAQLERALLDLTIYLERQHDTRALVLLDEYDTPLHSAQNNGFYEPALAFFRNLLSAVFKDNAALHKGVLTGVLRVAKDSIFTGLNNLDVCSVLTRAYSTAFGFTQVEVEELLRRGDLSPRLPEVQRWYNGYLFGGHVIYNPWSVLSFLKHQPDLPLAYWADTSSNELIRDLLMNQGAASSEDWALLLRGETLLRPISESVALPELQAQPGLLWSVLVFTGYLKVVGVRQGPNEELLATLTIPNEEVRTIYRTHFSDWLTSGLGGDLERRAFLQALLSGDAEEVERLLEGWLLRHTSYHDAAQVEQPERFYHGLILGLLVSLGPDYDVRSNPEAGYGRCDLLITPRKPGLAGVVLELKVANHRKRESLAAALRAAQQQLLARDYAATMRESALPGSLPAIHELAIAWSGKQVRAAHARPKRTAQKPSARKPKARRGTP